MRRSIITYIVVLMLIIFGFGCGSKKDPIVAVINHNRTITLPELLKDFGKGFFKESYGPEQFKTMALYLDKLVENELKIVEAEKRDYNQDSTIVAEIEKETRTLLLRELFKVEIEDHVVREKDIREYYARQKKKILFRQILFLVSPQMPQAMKDSLADKADYVKQLLDEGGSFIQLAKEHSDDRTTAMNGGLQKPRVWTEWNDPIMAAAFHLKEAETSGVITTKHGFVIIKIEEIDSNELKPYENMYSDLRKKLMSQRRDELKTYYQEYWKNLKEESEISIDDSLLNFAVQLISENIRSLDKLPDLCKEYEAENNNHTVVTFKNGQWALSELAERINNENPRAKLTLRESKRLRQYINDNVMLDRLYKIAKKKNLQNNVSIKEKIQIKLDKMLLDKINKIELDDKIAINDSIIHAYYEDHIDDKYSLREQVKIQEIVLKDEATAQSVLRKAKAGYNFTNLVKKYSERESSKKKSGYVGFFVKGGHGKVGSMAFKIKNNEIAGPAKLSSGEYVVFKRIDYKPKKPHEFEKIADEIKHDYFTEQKFEVNKIFVEQLKEKYPVEIYKENMESVFEYN